MDKRLVTIIALPAAAALLMLWHGPIAQLPHYHDFADRRIWCGIPNAADVLSNLAFALVGALGLARSRRIAGAEGLAYILFFAALGLTALGSAYYHWAPDNARLVWDRLPIAVACAALVDAVAQRQLGGRLARGLRALLWLAAPASVGWWRWTDLAGAGDLRPYLFLQALPLLAIPLLLALYPAPRTVRLGFGGAVGLYLLAKLAELADAPVLALSGGLVSGHTLKHLLAASAALCIVWMLSLENRRGGSASGAPGTFPAPAESQTD